MSLLSQALRLTGRAEGGFVVDNGGPTNFGVTIGFLADYWRKKGIVVLSPSERDIRALTKLEAEAAYEAVLWGPMRLGFFPAGVGYAVFDAAINSGAHQAAKWLQQIVGTPVDGIIGQQTVVAVHNTDPIKVIRDLSKLRSRLMLGMNNAVEETNEKGWHARLIDVTADAILINLNVLKA